MPEKTAFVPCLDLGSVEVIDAMGSDRAIAEAAWVSSSRAVARDDNDVAKVVRYMARNNHWTPFGQTAIKMRFRIPIFVARQLMRSNIGVVWNEESRRYVDTPPEFHVPSVWRCRSESMKQGSGAAFEGIVRVEDSVTHETWDGGPEVAFEAACRKCLDTYNGLLKAGIAPEQARIVLPVAMYTTIMATFNVASLARVFALRSHPHAQQEIQELAHSIDIAVRKLSLFDVAWSALTTK